MINIVLLILLSLPSFSAIKLGVSFYDQNVKQGEIASAKIVIDPQSMQKFGLQKLKGQTLAETLYIYDVSPSMKKEGQNDYESEAKIIFIKVPETTEVKQNVDAEEVTLAWGDITVTPTEAPQGFVFGNFEIPRVGKWALYLLIGLLVAGFAGSLGYWLSKKSKIINEKKRRIQEAKAQVLSCSSYEDLVNLWKKKHHFIELFPHIKEPFLRFETTLNRYQFKPSRSEKESEEIMAAYREFKSSVEGGFNGI